MAKPFEKNDPRINRSGRPKGRPNSSTEELRRLLHGFIDTNIDTLQADFDKLEPLQRLNLFEKLLSHVLPKPITSLFDFSEEELNYLLEKIKQTNGQIRKN